MASRVVAPESKKIDISDGDWILVKQRLSAGDRDDSFERMYLKQPDGSFALQPDGRLIVAPAQMRRALVTAYLLDWSLVGLRGEPLVIRGQPIADVEATLRSIDTASFQEIHAAIEQYDVTMALERMAQKKMAGTGPASNSTSDSPSAAAGATNGSANSTKTSTASSSSS